MAQRPPTAGAVAVEVDEGDVLKARPFQHEDTCYICLSSLSSATNPVQGEVESFRCQEHRLLYHKRCLEETRISCCHCRPDVGAMGPTGPCLLVMVAMMNKKLAKEVQLRGLGIIVTLCLMGPTYTQALCDAGACKWTNEMIVTYKVQGDREIMSAALEAIIALASLKYSGRENLLSVGSCVNVCNIMTSWPRDKSLQAKGLTAMSKLIKMDKNAASVLHRTEACRIIFEALERHKEEKSVLAHAVEAISLLNVPGSKALADGGGIRALCEVMRRNAQDADMQTLCSQALCVLSQDERTCDAIDEAGGTAALLKVCSTHAANSKLAFLAATAMEQLAVKSVFSRSRLVRLEAADVVGKMMTAQTNKSDAKTTGQGLKVLAALATDPSFQFDYSAIERFVGGDDADLVLAGLRTITSLSSKSTIHRARLNQMGVKAMVEAAMDRFPDCEELQAEAQQALDKLDLVGEEERETNEQQQQSASAFPGSAPPSSKMVPSTSRRTTVDGAMTTSRSKTMGLDGSATARRTTLEAVSGPSSDLSKSIRTKGEDSNTTLTISSTRRPSSANQSEGLVDGLNTSVRGTRGSSRGSNTRPVVAGTTSSLGQSGRPPSPSGTGPDLSTSTLKLTSKDGRAIDPNTVGNDAGSAGGSGLGLSSSSSSRQRTFIGSMDESSRRLSATTVLDTTSRRTLDGAQGQVGDFSGSSSTSRSMKASDSLQDTARQQGRGGGQGEEGAASNMGGLGGTVRGGDRPQSRRTSRVDDASSTMGSTARSRTTNRRGSNGGATARGGAGSDVLDGLGTTDRRRRSSVSGAQKKGLTGAPQEQGGDGQVVSSGLSVAEEQEAILEATRDAANNLVHIAQHVNGLVEDLARMEEDGERVARDKVLATLKRARDMTHIMEGLLGLFGSILRRGKRTAAVTEVADCLEKGERPSEEALMRLTEHDERAGNTVRQALVVLKVCRTLVKSLARLGAVKVVEEERQGSSERILLPALSDVEEDENGKLYVKAARESIQMTLQKAKELIEAACKLLDSAQSIMESTAMREGGEDGVEACGKLGQRAIEMVRASEALLAGLVVETGSSHGDKGGRRDSASTSKVAGGGGVDSTHVRTPAANTSKSKGSPDVGHNRRASKSGPTNNGGDSSRNLIGSSNNSSHPAVERRGSNHGAAHGFTVGHGDVGPLITTTVKLHGHAGDGHHNNHHKHHDGYASGEDENNEAQGVVAAKETIATTVRKSSAQVDASNQLLSMMAGLNRRLSMSTSSKVVVAAEDTSGDGQELQGQESVSQPLQPQGTEEGGLV